MNAMRLDMDDDAIRPTEEQRRRRRVRSVAIAVALGIVALIFYLVTILTLGPGVLERSL